MTAAGTPMVVALALEEALAALAAAGVGCAEIVETAAPDRREAAGGELFVVRQQASGTGSVRLTVARHPGRPRFDRPAVTEIPGSG